MSTLLWEVYFLVVAVALSIAIFLVDGSSLALLAVLGMAVLYVAVARSMILKDRQGTPALLVSTGFLILFGVAVAGAQIATWLMFGVIPLFFMLVTLRSAVVLVAVANVIPVVLQIRRAGLDDIVIHLVIAAVSTAAGLCMGVWITRMAEQSSQRAELIAELEASRAELARLSHEAGVAAERNRLAGEIHDTLAQGFTSIITLVQAVDPALRDERLALAVRTAKENLAESRAMVAALSPSALTSASSLPLAVRRATVRFTEESGVPCSFRTTGDERTLPTRAEVVLLRAAQESLTNIRRHAAAREATVVLAYTPSSVRLVVRDDGRGFDVFKEAGFGLTGMRARATEAGGALTIRSTPDSGTTLEVSLEAPE
ncbi:sensor histidine kinase [Actinoplanes couchii]|uniref:histidine kinase n=1 Tax=Actinoplanes couchii TaxID=403638 RepID=A0ABQ3X580_9ACTN|nr:sensor histidine kinase [Actinoplanes couchii]MDR6325972.1 signal transduction histidine kinase [Actinoplanes couchii]GID53675.1 two-component sensor histidine kinase [Actinoplanes couchii]